MPIAHAVETAVTRKRNALSWLYSREAFRLTVANLDRVLQQPDNLEARAAMQLGAAYAGTAIENSMLGAAHSAANPLTARFAIIHGQAVGMMLPHVMRFNAQQPEVAAIYAELAQVAGLATSRDRTEQAVSALIARIESLLHASQLPLSLSALNIPHSQLPMLAEEAAAQWTAQFNPRTHHRVRFRSDLCRRAVTIHRQLTSARIFSISLVRKARRVWVRTLPREPTFRAHEVTA